MTRDSIPGRRARPEPTDRDLREASDIRPDPRLAEHRERKRKGGQGVDKFDIPAHKIPTGWSYEWKRQSVYNYSDPSYQVELAENLWEPVPADRHPEFMPAGYKGATIERDGLILMERPMYATQEARDEEKRFAREQVRDKEAALTQAPRDTMERTKPQISRSYESIPIED